MFLCQMTFIHYSNLVSEAEAMGYTAGLSPSHDTAVPVHNTTLVWVGCTVG